MLSVQLACDKCKEEGKAVDCVHMLHLVPRWQSGERHTRLKVIMQDRPDLIISELSGLAFDSLQQAFRPCDLDIMFNQEAPPPRNTEAIYIAIDPAAGGPQSDYAMVSMTRYKGMITVRLSNTNLAAHVVHHDEGTGGMMITVKYPIQLHVYRVRMPSTMWAAVHCSLRIQLCMHWPCRSWKNRVAL